MKTAACIAALSMAAGASAFVNTPFAGQQVSVRSAAAPTSSLSMAANTDRLRKMTGVTAPFPEGFDPASISNNPQTGDKQLQKYREAELKHCRVAMLAFVGLLVQERFHPFFMGNEAQLGPASFHLQAVDANFPYLSVALLFGIGLTEAWTIIRGWSKTDYQDDGFVANLKQDYYPGDLGFDPLNLKPKDEAGFKNMQAKELNNGRLAMFATLGIWAQELVDHQSIWDHWASRGFSL